MKTQDRISGNVAKWAGGRHAERGDKNIAKMHDEGSGDKNIAKGGNRLSDGIMDKEKDGG